MEPLDSPNWVSLDDNDALRAAGLGHLASDAPFVQCDRCNRKSWDPDSPGKTCTMTQPCGHACGGTFR